MNQWNATFVENCLYRLDESRRMIYKALESVSEEQIWQRPNAVGNALGNQLLHLCGNMHQYLITTLGHQKDIRDRDREFDLRSGFSKKELLDHLDGAIDAAQKVLQNATDADFLKVYSVQAFELTGVGVALHAIEHCSYHTGQIAFWVKQLTEKDLGFYDQIDLNQKHNL
ncbi:MAG: DinB family protein [Flavobacteriaceae bacterium]